MPTYDAYRNSDHRVPFPSVMTGSYHAYLQILSDLSGTLGRVANQYAVAASMVTNAIEHNEKVTPCVLWLHVRNEVQRIQPTIDAYRNSDQFDHDDMAQSMWLELQALVNCFGEQLTEWERDFPSIVQCYSTHHSSLHKGEK